MSENPACSACHDAIDRIGFGLEGFDDQARPQAADTSGVVSDLDGASPSFDGPRELAELLAQSESVNRCVAQRWYEYALDRAPLSEGASPNLDCLADVLRESGGDLAELVVFLAQSEAFRTLPRWTNTLPPAPAPTSSALDHAVAELDALLSIASSEPLRSQLSSQREALLELRQSQP